ncbi:MAG: hemin receptor [Rhodobacteraceae bacterium]|nr:hemin receptor [Paracoccaceae bacterium]
MLETDHDRIRRTWAQAASISEEMSRVFYGNLFRLDPTTKPLFVGDLRLQGRKLVQTLGFIVDNLEEPNKLLPAASALAIRHVDYGVEANQYASVGAALIKTLSQLLGDRFSKEDEEAWAVVYGGLSDAMIKAAYPE